MDPREKREDESWAEYGARMASMGIEPSTPQVAFGAFPRPTSDYTPKQLNTPIRQLQQQNIPQNVVPIRPTDATLAGMATVPAGLRVKEQPSLIDIIDSREGTYGVSQDYRDFSPMMGTLADMAGDQPIYDESVVTDMPSRPVFDLPSYSTNMPDVSQTLSADTQLRMLDDAMPRTWGPVVPAPFEEASFTPSDVAPGYRPGGLDGWKGSAMDIWGGFPPEDGGWRPGGEEAASKALPHFALYDYLVRPSTSSGVEEVSVPEVAPCMQGVDYGAALESVADAGMAEVFPGSDTYTGDPDPGLETSTIMFDIGTLGAGSLAKWGGKKGITALKNLITKKGIAKTLDDLPDDPAKRVLLKALTAGTVTAAGGGMLFGKGASKGGKVIEFIYEDGTRFVGKVGDKMLDVVNALRKSQGLSTRVKSTNVLGGGVTAGSFTAAQELVDLGVTVDQADLAEMVSQVDTFKDIPSDVGIEPTTAGMVNWGALKDTLVDMVDPLSKTNLFSPITKPIKEIIGPSPSDIARHERDAAKREDTRQANKRAAMQKAKAKPAAPAKPAGPSAAEMERQKQAAINERLARQATIRQQQQQAADIERARMRDIALEQERSALAREQERVRQAAVAAERSRQAQAQRALEIIQQQQAERTAAEQTARVRREVARMLNAERDRGDASEAEIDAAIEAQGFDFGGVLDFPGGEGGGAAGAMGGYRGDPVGREAAIEARR